MRIGPFCSYCYRPGDLYLRFNILPTKTAALCDVWFCMHNTITCATVTRELNVVATCGLNHFTAIAPAYITYNSDLMFCSRKPQLSSTSGYYYNSRSKRHSHLRFEPFCIFCYRPGTCISYLTFCARKPRRLVITITRTLNITATCGLNHFVTIITVQVIIFKIVRTKTATLYDVWL